ncbi:hypothetical protein PHYPSEUDO_003645 [Phytophthora pseudosyringae]|uniref:Uncharacterized protein n=1 Tax=Phytophthora pseudosyringae TaxID=221518 RepID=A0A8T1VTY5_9STRA|nr:hypothetical protein PHYPSEUDO_003645 [Phytophthora pseudosyringae]
MKFSTFLVALMAVLGVVAAADQPVIKTSAEALEKVQASALPDGVTLIGIAEKIDPPAGATATLGKEGGKSKDDKKEQFGLGLGGWGGWGDFGPYRFGFMCGSTCGWAYPMGSWNMFGAGLYGGGCGLGIPFGGLYYC